MNTDLTTANIKTNFSIQFEKVALETALDLTVDAVNRGAIKLGYPVWVKIWANIMAEAANRTLEEVIKEEIKNA